MVWSLKSRLFPVNPGATAATLDSPESSRGFILIFCILMLLGISSMAVSLSYTAFHGKVAAQNHKNRMKAFYAADGMRTLLAQEVLDGNVKRYIDTGKVGEIGGEIWEGAGGGLDALKSAIGGRGPDSEVMSQYLGSNWKSKSNYGVRWRGYLIPPSNGAFTFFVRADDAGAFHLSEDDTPANLSADPIAFVESWSFLWPKTGTGVSQAVSLKAGKRYYFEFLHTQGNGEGFGQIGWKGPNFITERPIPGKRLSTYGSSAEKWDTAMVGSGRVKYSLVEAGPLVYSLNTEAVTGGLGDSSFRAPLNQVISMRGENSAPPDSLWQRVIYYDFHSDGSNPEFEKGECCFWGGVVTPDMVKRKGLRYTTANAGYFGLDSIGKPMRGPNPKWSCGVEKWFSPWQPGWFKTYAYAGGSGDCSETDIAQDRAFDNRVIMDSLLFLKRSDLGANAYQFKRFGDPGMELTAFAPIDGRGFGSEGKTDSSGAPHNFSFCMELHSQFEHTSGMVFEFNGDDDVWLFINDSLVMDQGFVHVSQYTSLVLDDLPLKFGETYPLDFFYCERQSWGSSIDLITNLPVLQTSTRPSSSWKREYGNLD